jgi:hypothetical protein
MKGRYFQIRNVRIARIVSILALLFVFVIILQKQSSIPIVDQTIDYKTDTVINIDIYDPYGKDIYLKMYDITKTKYQYHIKDIHKFGPIVVFNHTLENIDFSPVSNVEFADAGTHDISVLPKEKDISFYTRQILAENIQTTRLFFLTELIIFFLTLLGNQIIKVVLLISRKETDKRLLSNNPTWMKRCSILYLVGIFLFTFILYKINTMPIINIEEKTSIQDSGTILDLHDISNTCYRIKRSNKEPQDSEYTINYSQIVAFTFLSGEPSSVGPTQITYKRDRLTNEDFIFYTENLESQNIQEVRIFFITTLLLGFIGRLLFYLRKLIKYKWKNI